MTERRRTGEGRKARGQSEAPISRIIYLPDDLLEPIRKHCAVHNLTRTQLTLTALENTHGQLADLIEQNSRPTVITGSLFSQTQRRPVHRNRQVEIKPTASQLATIDALQGKVGARDRSQLCAVAIRAYLEGDDSTTSSTH